MGRHAASVDADDEALAESEPDRPGAHRADPAPAKKAPVKRAPAKKPAAAKAPAAPRKKGTTT